MTTDNSYLLPGLPAPVAAPDGLDQPFWEGLNDERLLIQRCDDCAGWQWGPEFCCHRCRSLNMSFEEIAPRGTIYSHQRIWHPVHPALAEQGAYVVVLVALAEADDVRIVGNLIGDPEQSLEIGHPVEGVFEHHGENEPPFTLLHWKVV